MDDRERIVNELLKHEIVVEPEVLPYIIKNGGMTYLSDFIKKYGGLGYITRSDLQVETQKSNDYEKKAEEKTIMTRPSAYEYDWDFEVIMNPDVNMRATGGADDFQRLFEDRYERIKNLLKRRQALREARKISRLNDGESSTIGMVSDIRRTSKGKLLFELEDSSGIITCLYSGNTVVLNDEVIGVVGNYRKDRKTMYVKEIVKPDVRWVREPRAIEENIGAAIISDTHIGSNTFIKERWEKFLKWLKSGKDGAEIIKYLIIAGDLVDGIGVYPHQEEELEILDIFKQYEVLANYLADLPDYIKVITIPGNHDMVRNAEPQPSLPNEIRKLFDPNVEFLSNPSMFSLHGYKFLVYHGASLNNLVELIPGMDYLKTKEMMEYMLKTRHLSPVYGEKVPVVPLDRDYLVIDPQPDVFVTGHVHTFSYGIYKGVHLINASAWQEQTKYQKMMNFNPDPGKVSIINFHTDEVQVKVF